MKESELNIKVRQTLNEFESLGGIQPSADWDQSFLNKLGSTRTPQEKSFQSGKSVVVMLFVILVNVGIILSLISNDNRRSFQRSNDLRTISSEFLINPTSSSE